MFICDSGARDVLGEENIEGTGMEELPDKPKNFKYLKSPGLDGINDELFRRVQQIFLYGVFKCHKWILTMQS